MGNSLSQVDPKKIIIAGVVIFLLAMVGLGVGLGMTIQKNSNNSISNNDTTVTTPGTSRFANISSQKNSAMGQNHSAMGQNISATEHFGNSSVTYKAIGYGPAIDTVKRTKLVKWKCRFNGLNFSIW